MAGLSDSDIEKMLAKQSATGNPSLSDEEISRLLGDTPQAPAGIAREAAIASGSALRGATGLLGAPGDIEQYVNNRTGIPQALGLTGESHALPTSGDINKSLGLEQRPDLTPSGNERYLAAAAGGLGAALPIAATGGAAAPAIVGGISGGLGAEVAHEAMPESPWAPLLGGLFAGGMGGFATSKWLSRGGMEKLASSLGASKTFQEAGETMRTEASSWMTRLPARKQALWSDLDNTMAVVGGVSKAGGPAVGLSNFMPEFLALGPSGQAIARRLGSGLFAQMLGSVAKGGAKTGPAPSFAPTWSGARDLWRVIDDIRSNPSLVKGIGQAKLDRLSSALGADLAHAAGSLDPRLVDVAHNALLESERLNQFASKHVQAILNPKASPEKVAARYANSAKLGGSDLADLRSEMPRTVDELAAAMVRKKPGVWLAAPPEAKVALVPRTPTRDTITKAVREGVLAPESGAFMHILDKIRHGSPLGAGLGYLLEHHLGGNLEEALGAGALGAVITAFAPGVTRSAKALVSSPAARAGAAAGGAEGSNLQPPP